MDLSANTRIYNTGIGDMIQVITSTKLTDAIEYGNLPEAIYGIPAIPIDPFQTQQPCWKYHYLTEIQSCIGADGKTYLY